MEHPTDLTGLWYAVTLLSNLIIVAGYLIVPFTVLKYLPLSLGVRIAGTFFFLTCAITHLSMAFEFHTSRWMVVNHAVQAVSVVWFVLGFWLLLRSALRRAGEKRNGQDR